MKNIYFSKTILIFLIVFFTGCVSISYVPSATHVTYPPTSSLKVYWEKPIEPYTELGMLVGIGVSYEQIFNTIKEKAMSMGADAIIMKPSSQETIVEKWPASNQRIHRYTYTRTTYNKLEALAIRFKK